MNGWVNNLISYIQKKDTGHCPYCSSSDIQVERIGTIRKSLVFKCMNCHKSEHFDGITEKSTKPF